MRGYKSASWYIKQLKEETEKIKITDQDCFNRDEYRERLWEIKRCVDQIKKDRPIGKNEEMVGRKKKKEERGMKRSDIRVVYKAVRF